MGYATTSTGYVGVTNVAKDSRVLKGMFCNGMYLFVRQNVTSTTVVYRGLSKTAADGVCVSSESSTLSGTTRAYLGGVRVQYTSGSVTSWFYVDQCWGTKVTSQLSRSGDSTLFDVAVTTQVFTLTTPTGTGITVTNV